MNNCKACKGTGWEWNQPNKHDENWWVCANCEQSSSMYGHSVLNKQTGNIEFDCPKCEKCGGTGKAE